MAKTPPRWTERDIPSQRGRLAIVTGANSGLGASTATELAAAGADVILACRTPQKAEPVVAAIRARQPQANVRLMALDLSSLASVRAFAADVLRDYLQVDLLVNNAGIMAVPFAKTVDGFESQMGTNHLGHFALTGLLLPRLMTAPAARIINVASLAHRAAKRFEPDNLDFARGRYDPWDAYGRSKLANLLFTFELARRLQRADTPTITAVAHPGYSATNLAYNGTAMTQGGLGRAVVNLGNSILAQPAERGALPQLFAATAAEVANGDYIGPNGWFELRGWPKKVGCRALARDRAVAAALWTASEQLTDTPFLSALGGD